VTAHGTVVRHSRPEVELILCCARQRVAAGSGERIRALLQRELDWELLLRTALPQGVTPLLYHALSTTCPEAVPLQVIGFLRDRYNANARRNLLLSQELHRLLATLEAHSIRAIPFKGPLLAASAYGELALRHSYDLDLLVEPRDVEPTKAALASHGYTLEWGADWEWHLAEPDHRWLVDLHQDLAPRYFPAPGTFDELWARREPVLLAGRPVLTLGTEDLLIELGVQLAKDCREWKQRLAQICDTAELLRAHPDLDWDLVVRRARAMGGVRILLFDLHLASRLLDVPLPERIRRAVQAEPVLDVLAAELRARLFPEAEGPAAAIGYRVGGKLHEDSWFYLRLRERPRDKARYLYQFAQTHLQQLIAPSERDRRMVVLPPRLRSLYYPLRVTRVLIQFVRTGSLRSEQVRAAGATRIQGRR
jgi:Uncharacterised nucleotidyltransferase